MSYRIDLRTRVVNWVRSGKSRMSASQVFDVHYNTVKGWVKKFQETGDCRPRARVSTSRRKLDPEALRQDVQISPFVVSK